MDKPTETASDATAAAPEADPELDIHSEQFNPLKALLVNEDQLLWMCEDAPVHDNVAMFESRMKRMESSGTANTATKATKKSQRYVRIRRLSNRLHECNKHPIHLLQHQSSKRAPSGAGETISATSRYSQSSRDTNRKRKYSISFSVFVSIHYQDWFKVPVRRRVIRETCCERGTQMLKTKDRSIGWSDAVRNDVV